MKTTRNILTALIAAGTPGVALLALNNRVPADVVLGGITAVGLVAFAIYDFSRHTASLEVRAPLLRPPLRAIERPVTAVARKAA